MLINKEVILLLPFTENSSCDTIDCFRGLYDPSIWYINIDKGGSCLTGGLGGWGSELWNLSYRNIHIL